MVKWLNATAVHIDDKMKTNANENERKKNINQLTTVVGPNRISSVYLALTMFHSTFQGAENENNG